MTAVGETDRIADRGNNRALVMDGTGQTRCSVAGKVAPFEPDDCRSMRPTALL